MFNIKQRDLYPTSVYHVDIYDEKENEEYKKFLLDLSEKDPGQVRSNRGGFQSNTLLWKEEVFKPLLEKSSHVIQSIISDIIKQEETPQIMIRSMWGNVNPRGGYNFTHVHPTGWMSGVYYIQIPNEESPLVFEDPRPARMMDFQRSALLNDEYFAHRPEVGQLVLFPSWLPHFVNPNTSDDFRISISFNVELVV
jgi:uncharacterized protein (TIGR02466 family)